MCRHHEAEVSQDQMADIFGRLPVRMRDYVRLSIGKSTSFCLFFFLLLQLCLKLLPAFPGRGSRSAYT